MDMVDKSCDKQIITELGGSTKLKASKAPPPTEMDVKEAIVYDYMKYPSKKSKTGHQVHNIKSKKSVSFKRIVEFVSFTEDWKMLTSQSNLRSEDEQ
ncbi:hypothetical protein KR222_000332, partial [Zaprionus bogoriensis]